MTSHQRVARVYTEVRTAHLERLHAWTPARLIYGGRRYDFDAELAAGLDLVPAGLLGTAWQLVRSQPQVLEVNEPMMPHGIPRAAAAIAATRLAGWARRAPTTRVVTYAIGNLNEWDRRPARWRGRVRRQGEIVLSRWVLGQIDRIAFGTDGARSTYLQMYGDRLARTQERVIPALPAPCDCPSAARDPHQVLFVGALHRRKGIELLVAAWPLVARDLPQARLTVIGTGELAPVVQQLAAHVDGVQLIIDPPRARIHTELRRSAVLTLLSQRTAHWREQVGLPILEGLAHGCAVVTTTETGIADWLTEHGHTALDPAAEPSTVAAAIVAALRARRTPACVLADLPAVDGRTAADTWLTAHQEPR